MNYQIIWSNFSELQLDSIFDYYTTKASKRTALKIIQKIITEVNILEKNPFAGQIEELLLERKTVYRYIVVSNYKVIYQVDETDKVIKIADVFDTRQNPVKITREK